ncbi:MAG TPA: transporter substrate-binding domain-containing protein [Burkholderiales bacterium]|nr:transporter substrate-binding domain-containing protein [Burkholderiales bacterium]
MTATNVSAAAKAELTSTGKLRAGINFQNVLLTTLGPNGEQGGVAVEFARELARRLGVELEIVPYQSAGALGDSWNSGVWDICVLAEEAERAKVIEFATPLTQIEATYVVPAGSSIRSIDEVDRPGVRIAVAEKSGYELYLSRTLKNAQLVKVAGIKAAEERFVSDKLEALAGLKPQLLELAPKIAGARIIDGHFTEVRHTVGTPKGRPAAAAYLREVVEDVKGSGRVAQWIEKSGVKGLSVAPAVRP